MSPNQHERHERHEHHEHQVQGSFAFPPPYGARAGSTSTLPHYEQSSNAAEPPELVQPQPSLPCSSPFIPRTPHEKDDSPDSQMSQSTVTPADEKRGLHCGNEGSVVEKVNDTMRFVTIQKEMHEAKKTDELEDEVRGKKHWRVGGIGMWAYQAGDADVEEQKRKVWRDHGEKHGKDDWLKAARSRTDWYNKDSRGVRPLMQWKLVERGGHLPDNALPMGHEADGTMLYAARAWWEGGLHLGKAGSHLINKASISYGGTEHTLDIYEVLCGPSDPSLLQWRAYSHGEAAKVDGWQPVEGGREKDGAPLFIARGEYENGVHPGKCLIDDDHACVGWGGGELWVRPFQVLAYCSSHRR